jgi:hypothetical protein
MASGCMKVQAGAAPINHQSPFTNVCDTRQDMIRNRVLSFVFVAVCVACSLAQGKVERIGALADAKPPIAAAVEDKGYRVTLTGAPIAEIWLAKNAADAKTGSTSAVYPQFAKGTFVGVIKFVAEAKDFRGQPIKPGTYTMRYDLLPADGNHMGVAAQPDFVLLVPIGDDADPAKAMAEPALLAASRRAAGTSHPATFTLVPADSVKDFPSVYKSDDGFEVFAAKMNIGGRETPIAIVLKGQAAQ